MSNPNGTTSVGNENINTSEFQSESKGKGKAVDYPPQDMSLDEEDSSDEDDGAEEEVIFLPMVDFSSDTHFYSGCRTR